MKTLILVRHGDNERDWNKGDKVGLTSLGRRQIQSSADLLLEEYRDELIDPVLLLHSGIERGEQSSSILANAFMTATNNIHVSVDGNINSHDMREILMVYIGLQSPDYYRHHMPDDQEPGTVVIVTHAHNPFSLYLNVMLDPKSTMSTSFDEFTNDEIFAACLDDIKNSERPSFEQDAKKLSELATDKSHPLRKHYGGTSVYKLPIESWTQMRPACAQRLTAFSPYVV